MAELPQTGQINVAVSPGFKFFDASVIALEKALKFFLLSSSKAQFISLTYHRTSDWM
jgi:hypothetical protein